MTNEQYSSDMGPVEGHEDTEGLFNELWASGDKISALETAMGRYINTDDINGNPCLATIILQPTASQGYAAALLVKTLEQLAAKKPVAE